MKRTIFFIIFLFISCTINSQQESAQKIELTGRIIDSLSSKPIEFATISIKNENTLLGTTSDKNGNFNIKIDPGNYTVKVEYLSYTPKVYNKKNLIKNTNLGTVGLYFSAEILDEVEIISQKDLMEFKIDKKIYNASKDIANLNGNALDVLNNAPSVRIDEQGQAILRGSRATILIDGKPILGLDNGSDYLNSIPSSSIEKVEIITRSAKYSAEGGGGILNIITKKRKGAGLSGSLEAHLGRPDNNGASVFLNENTDKINIFSTISFNNEKLIKETTIEQTYFDNLGLTRGIFEEDRDDENQRNSFLFNIGSDFYLSNKSTLTSSLLINTHNKNFYSNLTLDDFDPNRIALNSAIRGVTDYDDISKIETFLNYTTSFDQEEHKLTIDFKFDNTVSENKASILEQISLPTSLTIDQRVKKDQKLDNFLFQVDYSLPINDSSMLEMGYKSTLKFYQNDFSVSQFDNGIRDFVTVGGFEDLVNYDEKIHALYGQFKVTKSALSYTFGLRTELSDIKFYDQAMLNNYSKNYLDFFPSASLGYEFDNGSYLSLNYSRSIERPQIPQLNPFISVNDERFQTRGNPNLNPYYNDYFEFLYDIGFDKINLASALFANMTRDQFLTVIQNAGQNSEGLDTYIRTSINSGEKKSIGADLDITYRPIKALRLRSYISTYNLDVSNTINKAYDFNSWVWYASLSSLVSFDFGLRLQANYIYQSPVQDGQTKLRTINFLNLTLSKDLFKSSAVLSFKLNDALNSKWFATRSFEANTNTIRRLKYNRSFTLGLTYNFKQVRKSAKDRSNELNKDELEDIQDKKM